MNFRLSLIVKRGTERHLEEEQILRYKYLRGQERLGDVRSNSVV